MSTVIRIVGAIIFFIALNIFIQGNLNYEGKEELRWTMTYGETSETVNMPYYKAVTQAGTYSFRALMSPVTYNSLVIPQVNAYAINVYQDDLLIYQKGSFDNPTANIWGFTHLVRLLPNHSNNLTNIRIELHSYHDTGIKNEPTLAMYDNVYEQVAFQNFLNVWMIYMIIGGYGAVGLLLILLARTSYRNLSENDVAVFSFFGLASFAFAVFMVDSMYRVSTVSPDVLLLVRKISYMSLYVGVYFLILGNRRHLLKKTTSRNVMYAMILLCISVVVCPNFYALYYVVNINMITVFIAIFYSLKISVFSRNSSMVFSGTILALTAFQSILIDTGFLNGSYTVHYGLFIYMMSMIFIVAFKYGNIEKASIDLSRKVVQDALTGAYNRAYLSNVEMTAGDQALFLDLDGFKIFNDTHGHDMGDALLVDLVRLFKKSFGKAIEIIRYGGDEFVLILRKENQVPIEELIEEVKQGLKTIYPDSDFSYGYLEFDGDVTDTLIQADHAMYAMKKTKRPCE